MLQAIWEFIKRVFTHHLNAFWVGTFGSSFVYFPLFFIGKAHWSNVILAALIKMVMATTLSFVTGLAAALAADIYKHRLQKHIEHVLKPSQNGQSKRASRKRKDDEKRA